MSTAVTDESIDSSDRLSDEFILAIAASILAAILLLTCFILFTICMWRFCRQRPPRQAAAPPNKQEGQQQNTNGEQTDEGGTLLLPRHTGKQPWLDISYSTRRGLRNLSREAFVNLSPKQRLDMLQVSQSKICFLTEMTETNFGKVYRGEASRLQQGNDEASTAVMVKSLKEMASGEDEGLLQDFHVEMVWASGFDHPNVIQLLAVCTTEQPRIMIYEYLEFGNLVEFLRSTALVWLEMDLQSRASLTATETDSRIHQNTQQVVGNEELVAIAIQIADGLNYISSHKIILKDIGARNCQVGKGLIVKITDFGLSYDVHSEDYCRIGSKDSYPVPLRWLSPESLGHSRYSMYSDIWSYGVLLWEVFSFGERPYGQLTNAETAEHIIQHKTLEKPQHCSDNIFNIIKCCWCMEPTERKVFNELKEELSMGVANLDISDISKRFSMKSPNTPEQQSSQPQTTTSLDASV